MVVSWRYSFNRVRISKSCDTSFYDVLFYEELHIYEAAQLCLKYVQRINASQYYRNEI